VNSSSSQQIDQNKGNQAMTPLANLPAIARSKGLAMLFCIPSA
jgi:hypothetical protein